MVDLEVAEEASYHTVAEEIDQAYDAAEDVVVALKWV